MYSHNTPYYYSGGSAMANYAGHWPHGQNVQTPNQNYPYGGPPVMATNHNIFSTWSSPQLPYPEHTIFEANHIQNTSSPQPTQAIQHITQTPQPVQHPTSNVPKPCQNTNTMAKRHRAMITFIPTATGQFKTIVKRKRKRTIFTTEQLKALEDIYEKKQYITREERQAIVEQLQINDKAVKTWFQNRRLKEKKAPGEDETEHAPTERCSPDSTILDNVESKINEKVDQFGYVSLDDSLIKDLFHVIDDVLTNNETPNVPAQAPEVTEDSSPIYEPISPAGAHDINYEQNTSGWQPAEPSESLQRLFDLKTMYLV